MFTPVRTKWRTKIRKRTFHRKLSIVYGNSVNIHLLCNNSSEHQSSSKLWRILQTRNSFSTYPSQIIRISCPYSLNEIITPVLNGYYGGTPELLIESRRLLLYKRRLKGLFPGGGFHNISLQSKYSILQPLLSWSFRMYLVIFHIVQHPDEPFSIF